MVKGNRLPFHETAWQQRNNRKHCAGCGERWRLTPLRLVAGPVTHGRDLPHANHANGKSLTQRYPPVNFVYRCSTVTSALVE